MAHLANILKRPFRTNVVIALDRLHPGVTGQDYRQSLFEELRLLMGECDSGRRFLEIGPKDGQDTERLLTLKPARLDLVDLKDKEKSNQRWLKKLGQSRTQIVYHTANVMYDRLFEESSFDVIWCTGVLYHNPEQLRMIKRLFDLLKPRGWFVIESATTREPLLRNQNCVQILHPPSQDNKKKYHVSNNVTHLPSSLAIRSWLEMVDFENIQKSSCHYRQSRVLAKTRVAYLCQRPDQVNTHRGQYYQHTERVYEIGKSL